MAPQPGAVFTIGRLAQIAGVKVDTVRSEDSRPKLRRSIGSRVKVKPLTNESSTANATVTWGCQPRPTPIARPVNSPIAQPVRQCRVTLAAPRQPP